MIATSRRVRPMRGRDPNEAHRTATPLELLFDLTFVVAFSQAGTQAAELFGAGHRGPAIAGFCFAVFGVSFAWIGYSWLASAYDNDDVVFRIATFVQMLGVLLLALGLPEFFESLERGVTFDNRAMTAGYVVMRVATVALWLRAALDDPPHRRSALLQAGSIFAAQVGWVVLSLVSPEVSVAIVLAVLGGMLELAGPMLAEGAGGTPWHADHITERYGLVVIITIGEIVAGTVAAMSAVIADRGWSAETVLVAFGGTLLAFGMWWIYFMAPAAEVLARHRRRRFGWGYGHIAVLGAATGTGAGLHVAGFAVGGDGHVGELEAVLAVVVPVGAYTIGLYAVYAALLRSLDRPLLVLGMGSIVVLAAAVVSVAAGASLGIGVVVSACSPLVIVLGFETFGRRRHAAALAQA